jgi:hypothetical protein
MLMDSKAILEGGRAFLLWAGLQGDLLHLAPDEAERQKASDYMGLMTPVLKAYFTEKGLKVCSDAMQVHGGSGFTEHFPASQYLRDVRISLIYEGTNGVQALDLVGRKLAANGGRAMMTFLADLDAYVAAHEGEEPMKPFLDGIRTVKAQLQDGVMWLMQNGLSSPDNAGAASTDFLHLTALAGLAWFWARIAQAALDRIAAGDGDPYYAYKLVTGRYFLERILPEAGAHLAKLKTGAEVVMALPAEAF